LSNTIQHPQPVFDPQGNAYLHALVWDGSNTQVYLSKALAGGGVSAPQPQFALPGPQLGNDTHLLSDRKGNLVFLVESYADDGSSGMQAWRYEPASGWQGPVTVYSGARYSGNNYGNAAVADDQGDILLVIHGYGAPAYFYSAVAKAWKPIAAPIQAPAIDRFQHRPRIQPIFGLQLVSNAGGDAIYLLYDQEPVAGFPYGSLNVRRFDASNLSWGPRRRLSGPALGIPSVAAAVDGDGVLSVVYNADRARRTVAARRLRHGLWTRPTQVLDVAGSPAAVTLGTAVANGANHVLAAAAAINSSATARVYAVRWNGSRWLAETVSTVLATDADYTYPMRVFPAWSGSGEAAVIAFSMGGYSSASYDDGVDGWSAPASPPALSPDSNGFFSLSTSPLGTPFAVYRAQPDAQHPSIGPDAGSWLLN
jgi:hypothetical protein